MHLERFIQEGYVYQALSYKFIQLKDLVEFARKTDLSVKLKDLKKELTAAGWTHRKASISTTEGFQSRDIWVNEKAEVALTRPVPVEATFRKNINEVMEDKADEILTLLFEKPELLANMEEVIIEGDELIYTNQGIRDLLAELGYAEEASRLSSVIRKRSSQSLMGEVFYGSISRTTLFKNYYKYIRK